MIYKTNTLDNISIYNYYLKNYIYNISNNISNNINNSIKKYKSCPNLKFKI